MAVVVVLIVVLLYVPMGILPVLPKVTPEGEAGLEPRA